MTPSDATQEKLMDELEDVMREGEEDHIINEPRSESWGTRYRAARQAIREYLSERTLTERAGPMGESEFAARICEEMRPPGGRMWTPEQAAVFEALTAAAENIRNPEKIHMLHALNISDDSRFDRPRRASMKEPE